MRKVLFLVSVIGVSGLRSPNPVGGVTSPRSKRLEALESEFVVLKNKVANLEKQMEDPRVKEAMAAKNLRKIHLIEKRKDGRLIAWDSLTRTNLVSNPTQEEINAFKKAYESQMLRGGFDPYKRFEEWGI